jgi:hypothetical protein
MKGQLSVAGEHIAGTRIDYITYAQIAFFTPFLTRAFYIEYGTRIIFRKASRAGD